MRRWFERGWGWFIHHAKTLDLFPEYVRAVYHAWHDYLWSALPVAPIIIWWMVDTPPMWIIGWTFIFALVVAGYYAWRADHLRLLPKLEFAPQVFIEPNKTTQPYVVRHYLQVLPKCLTQAAVEQCQGRLLRIMKWNDTEWESTAINEPLDLVWSFHDSSPRTIRPGVDQRLNILWVDMRSITLEVDPKQTPVKAEDVLKFNETYRFDVMVTSKDCPSINISVKAAFGEPRRPQMDKRLPISLAAGIISESD